MLKGWVGWIIVMDVSWWSLMITTVGGNRLPQPLYFKMWRLRKYREVSFVSESQKIILVVFDVDEIWWNHPFVPVLCVFLTDLQQETSWEWSWPIQHGDNQRLESNGFCFNLGVAFVSFTDQIFFWAFFRPIWEQKWQPCRRLFMPGTFFFVPKKAFSTVPAQFVTGHTQRPRNSSRPKNMMWPILARNWAMSDLCVAIGWWLSWVNLSKISAFDEIGGWLNRYIDLFKDTFSCTQVFRFGILMNWINGCVLERCISFLKANDGFPSLP